MEIQVQRKTEIEDGAKKGVIVDVEYRTEPYNYTDVVIEFKVDDKPFRLKTGYATTVTESSNLGKLLMEFGAGLEVGQMIDPNKILIGKKCKFMTLKKGKFVNILPESVKHDSD